MFRSAISLQYLMVFDSGKRAKSGKNTRNRDFLPQDVPNARIMTFGYNADVAFGNTTSDITDHAKALLSSLVDKREEDHETRKPIVFVGHSLGGIVIKQALFQARIEQRYNSISESTIGIIFLGTPHRGSEKAAYGKVLATAATVALNKPPPRLLNALQVNSEALMRLTTDFRFQLPKYQVYSFYEMKPMKMFSTLVSAQVIPSSTSVGQTNIILCQVVEKHSALLDIDGEEQIPVNASHEEMCKFAFRDDDTYEKLFMRIRRMLKVQDSGSLNSSYNCSGISYNKHYYVPYNLSGIFTGRDDIIRKLREGCLPSETEDRLVKQKRFVLYGLGGSGKTQACLKFAQDHREKFWAIFWIDASSQATAQQGLREIARICGVEENPKVVKRWLSNIQDRWLLIIDNADDPSMDVSEFFPTGNRGCILLTTRNPNCKIHATVGSCELGKMYLDEAVTLFLRAAGVEDTTTEIVRNKATPVAETLGCLALAIVQAGSYIRKGLCRIGEYCDIYFRHRERLLKHRPVQMQFDYKYSVYTTWEVSIEAIKKLSGKASDNAIELIRIFCFLHYDEITEDICERAWKNSHRGGDLYKKIANLFYIHSQEGLTEWDPIVIREAAVLLASFSLIKIDETGHRMSIHPLVHTWARDRLSEKLQRHYWTMASSTLAAAISGERQLSDYRFRHSMIPHIDSCIYLCKDGPFLSRYPEMDQVDIAASFAFAFAENGRLQSAMELRVKVLEASQRTLGNEHPNTLVAMSNLASSYSDLGRRQEAMELRVKVLEASQRTLGNEHPNTLIAMGNLASSYSDLGRRQEAMELRVKVLEANQRTLGNEHPDTLMAMNNLANSYSYLGRRQEAMELRVKVLEASQRMLGNEHPDTLRAMHNLASSYSHLGRRQEAMELRVKVLEASQRTLGNEHPDTLMAMNNLANSYSDLGRRQEAMELRVKVLEASQRTLGNDHPDTLTATHNLASSYSDLGRRQEAMELRVKGLEASQRTLGNDHPDTLTATHNLANSYSDLGRRQEAMELRVKGLEASQRTLGNEHPDTLMAMGNLASSYSDLGRRQEAMGLEEKVLEAWQRTLGNEHPNTLIAMGNLAISYSHLGRVGGKPKDAGNKHPSTLIAMSNLAISYSDLGRRQEAMELREKVLEASQRMLGNGHPDTLTATHNLASSYSDLGRRQEAIELRKKVLDARQRTLGNEHPNTLTAMSNLAVSYSDLGRWQEAVGLVEKVLEARQRTLGNEHPDTLIAMDHLLSLKKPKRRDKFKSWLKSL
ncbi:MAG: hypothetical protein M1839_001967 [Geoglossum umbratile]|nr:MAG: hypothetical protein M1839_001967 [Geoglossum umbratile]